MKKKKPSKDKTKVKYTILKKSEIKELREKLSTGSCPLLGCELNTKAATQAALDHDHTGDSLVRGVLSMAGNTFLGRIEKGYKKWCQNHTELTLEQFLSNVIQYLEQPSHPVQHPEHRDKHKRKVSKWKDNTLKAKIRSKGHEVPDDIKRRALVNLYLDVVIFGD